MIKLWFICFELLSLCRGWIGGIVRREIPIQLFFGRPDDQPDEIRRNRSSMYNRLYNRQVCITDSVNRYGVYRVDFSPLWNLTTCRLLFWVLADWYHKRWPVYLVPSDSALCSRHRSVTVIVIKYLYNVTSNQRRSRPGSASEPNFNGNFSGACETENLMVCSKQQRQLDVSIVAKFLYRPTIP